MCKKLFGGERRDRESHDLEFATAVLFPDIFIDLLSADVGAILMQSLVTFVAH